MANPSGIPVYLEGGCHLAIFLLSFPKSAPCRHERNSALESVGSHLALSRFGCYLRAHQACQTGLASSYVAFIGDDYVQKCLRSSGGKWHKLTNTTSQNDLSPLERLSQSLEAGLPSASPQPHKSLDNTGSSVMALQIHSLMDKMPKSGYSVVEVYWLVEAGDLLPPSCCIDLYGALLRLKEWHSAHIEVIAAGHMSGRGGARDMVSLPGLQAWREALDVDAICSCNEWSPPTGVIWRGDIHFTECKNCKQAVNQTVSFPSLSLTLCPILASHGLDSSLSEQGGGVTDLLRGVGVVSYSYYPTHLQLLQVVDYSTVPLFWISPLRCKLTISSDHSVTKALFKSLMEPNSKNVAFIMCLCQLDESLKETQQGQHGGGASSLTTANWLAHVSGLEEGGEVIPSERSVSPLAAYETGPLLLVLPTREGSDITDDDRWSYDAWFLWRPEAIDSSVFVKLKAGGLQMAEDSEEDELEFSLPLLLTPGDSSFSPTDSPCSPSDIHSKLSSLRHELSVPPSDSIEMKALKTHEWIQRKMIRRLTTPDLMFGQMVAPPPVGVASLSESVSIADVLSCFTSQGLPTNTNLSPIAMRDPSQVTRVHDPASSDVSYNTIISSTPSSKKQYHGIHYCLTNDDTSKDTKWTKIQQRCLISERAGHCSNISTPRAERDQRQSRRLKEVQLQNSKKQQKQRESEGQGKRKNTESSKGEEGGKVETEDKENGAEGGESVRRREKEIGEKEERGREGVVLKSRRSLNFPRSDVKLVKSPTVKITRLPSSLRQSGFAKLLPPPTSKNKVANLQTKASKMSRGPLAEQTVNATNQDQVRALMASPLRGRSRTTSELSEDSVRESQGVGEDSSIAMECSSSVLSPSTPPCTIVSEHLLAAGISGVGSSPALRRSPRLKKRSSDSKKGSSSYHGDAAKKKRKSDNDKKKEKSLKAQLGESVVSVLKKNGVSRDHPLFKHYYTKLFNVSKHFLNDLKQLTGRKVVTEEMKRVVQLNIGRVVCPDNT